VKDEALYLRQDTQLEPLVDSWYAWSQLVAPTTAALNLTERHLKIMQSYIDAPQVHANAVKNPKMLGGPFIDYDGQRVDEIRELRDRTLRERANIVQLSGALQALDDLLRTEAKGYSLEPLYASVPDILKGHVELVYDLNHSATFRVLEGLLYRSPFYTRDAQSLMLSRTSGDDRPFVLSTPRLSSPGTVHLPVHFDDERVDALCRLKTQPRPWREIREMYAINGTDETTLRSFFTTDAPAPYKPYTGNGLRWRYFGHACILVEVAGVSILADPVLSYVYESSISRYTYADLPDVIDYVVITHNHIDHILFETMLQLRHRIRNVIVPRCLTGQLQDPSMKTMLTQCGFRNVVEIGDLDTIDDGEVSITAWPFLGEHGDLAIGSKNAYHVRVRGVALVFAADSCNVEPAMYRHLFEHFGDVDVLFVGMECNGAPVTWLYGPLMHRRPSHAMDQSRRLSGSNYEQVIEMVDILRCKDVYVYAMGQEPWLNYVMSIKYTDESKPIVESNRLLDECVRRGITAERLFGEKEILLNL
jgi:L-ascorbate metabolism protein UlaG (beta-lactamase superfamily)